MSQLLDDLRAARELIKDRWHWTTDVDARDENGNPVSIQDPSVFSFCAIGACARVIEIDWRAKDINRGINMVAALDRMILSRGDERSLSDFNDNSTHKEVLKLFDDTIQKENESESAA